MIRRPVNIFFRERNGRLDGLTYKTMKPENHHELADDNCQKVPPELIRALSRLREHDLKIPPAVDACILQSAQECMAFIREKPAPRAAAWPLWLLAAAACFVVAWTALQPAPSAGKTSVSSIAKQEDAAAVILREFSALYPNQVKAIIHDSRGIQLSLSDKPDVISGKAFVFTVCKSRICEEIITFSGQNIEVAGHQVKVRTAAGGRVILAGEKFLWSSDFKGNPEPGIHIESRRL